MVPSGRKRVVRVETRFVFVHTDESYQAKAVQTKGGAKGILDGMELLRQLSGGVGVSGYENTVADIAAEGFKGLVDDVRLDKLGNLIMLRRGRRQGQGVRGKAPKVMLAAHMDEIGLIITKIESDGFLRFAPMGGIDQRLLPGQEVLLHGRGKDLYGVIGAKPPHIQTPEEREKTVKMEDLFIDTGLSYIHVREHMAIGDMVTFAQDVVELRNDRFAGKAFDDRAGVAAMLECLKFLQNMNHAADVYAVATVQEEVGVRGAATSTFGIVPDVGIAIDVGHGEMPGVPETRTIKVGGGPGIAVGPHVHPKILERLRDTADRWHLDFSLEPSTVPNGTDAYSIQITQAGIATALLSLPLRYMHTPVELLEYGDVEKTGQLLALFISSVDNEFVEGLRCF